MIRFLTWLIIYPATGFIKIIAKIKYHRNYRRVENAYNNMVKNTFDIKEVSTKEIYRKIKKSLTLRERFEIWKLRIRLRIGNHINKCSWKKVEKNLYRD